MKVININTREVLFDDDPDRNFAVYVVVIENTNENFEKLMNNPGMVEWDCVQGDLTEAEAIAKANEIN